jgi:osmoprotectant transport system substrate-binding protein
VTLEGPEDQFARQHVLPIVKEGKATVDVRSILNGSSAELTTEDLLALNTEVVGSRKTNWRTQRRRGSRRDR